MKAKNYLLLAGILTVGLAKALAQPVIILPPQWQTNAVGSTAMFSVVATGVPPLSYQWRFNAVDRIGSTNATLLLPNVQTSNMGLYSVVVSNPEGGVTSIVARLYVVIPVNITAHPLSQFVDIGSTAAFAVQATGGMPFGYQWRFNGVDLQGKTSISLSLTNVGPANAGDYTVLVKNAVSAATSGVATLTVVPTKHAFSSIRSLPDASIVLTLTGYPRSLFTPYFDIYPIEASTDLINWTPLTTLLRTNASTNALVYRDSESMQPPARFYRTPTNHFVTPLIKPTGPFAVGRVSFLLSDTSRTNRNNIPANSSFMVSYWYPADPKAGQLPDIWEDKPLAEDRTFWGAYTDRVPQFVTHALRGANVSTIQSKYPVIIYVAGFSGTRAENLEKFEDLASHGYIVISADHWEVYGTVFPDGTYLHGSSVYAGETSAMLADPQFARMAFDRRIRDVRTVLADLDGGESSASGVAAYADTNNIGLMGFSFGGGVAGEMCRTNERCRAAVIMDAGGDGANELLQYGLQNRFS